jgi:hypothetical protein
MHPKLVTTQRYFTNGLDWYVTGTLGLFGDVSPIEPTAMR